MAHQTTMKDKKLLLVIPTLGHGGAQKVITELAQYLCENNTYNEYKITLLTFRKENAPIHPVNDHINLIHIPVITGESFSIPKLIACPWSFRSIVKEHQPDAIIVFQDIANFISILATLGLKIPLIVSERNDPDFYNGASLRKALRTILYPAVDKVIVQTSKIAAKMPKMLQGRTIVIPNVVPKTIMRAQTAIPNAQGKYVILCAGRLVPQKNHLLLIDAYSKLNISDSWTLRIYGEGRLREQLEQKIAELGLENCVSIEPATKDIHSVMSSAHLFVLSSKFEGFPNILAEAVASDLPCIGYRFVSGVPELIEHQFNGILLNQDQYNDEKLAEAIFSLTIAPEKRIEMSKNCESVARKYNYQSIYHAWESAINSLLQTK